MAQHILTLIMTDEQLQDVYRILVDGDEPGALAFLRSQLRGKVREAMEGG